MMKKTFERELPAQYKEVMVIDASGKKLGIVLNLLAFVICAAILIPAFFLIRPKMEDYTISSALLLCGCMFAYLVLHELTHGAAYKLLTHQKLTLGMTMTVAFCGVPDIYVYRAPAMIALLAPFVVFIPIFSVPIFLLHNTIDQYCCAILLAIHVGGCIGDLWNTWLYLTRFRNPATLMNDTGPKQTFYLPGSSVKH